MRRNNTTKYRQSVPNAFKSTDISNNASIPALGPSFVPPKRGTTSYLERPGVKITSQPPINSEIGKFESIKNNRSGLGDNTLFRDGFRDQGPQPRKVVEYEIANLTPPIPSVTLSDQTLKDLFQVQTVDPSDVSWLTEYKRRKDAGESDEDLKNSPPLGRSQRTIFKTVNFAEATALNTASSLSISEQLKALKTAVTSSGADIVAILAKVLDLTTKFDTFTDENIKIMSEILNKTLAIDPDPKIYFGAGYHRFWSRNQFEAATSKMLPYLISNVPSSLFTTLTPITPVFSIAGSPSRIPALYDKLAEGIRKKVYDADGTAQDATYKNNDFYLDINSRGIVTRDFVVNQVNLGEDGGMIDGMIAPDSTMGRRWLTEAETDLVKKP